VLAADEMPDFDHGFSPFEVGLIVSFRRADCNATKSVSVVQ
jgi:hypothetical protein